MTRQQSEKDKDQLFRLRTEVQSYMQVASPDASSYFPIGETIPNTGGWISSPGSGLGLGRTQSDYSSRSQVGSQRKPSPASMRESDGTLGEMVEIVGHVWGVRPGSLEKDVADIHKAGSLDEVCL